MARAKRLPGKSKAPRRRSSKKSTFNKKQTLYIFSALAVLFLGSVLFWLFSSITNFKSSKVYYYNHQTLSARAFADTLKANGYIRSALPLQWALEHREINSLKPGLFEIEKGLSAYGLASSIVEKGVIKHMKFEIRRYRQRKNLLFDIAKQTDLSKNKLKALMYDETFLDSLGDFTKEDAWVMFVPGIYRFPEAVTERSLLEYIYDAHLFYWNATRRREAASAGLDPMEAYILASIVYAETKNIDEMPVIAGVYINRLHQKMRLQADPTALFAAGDFRANRVKSKHLNVESAYNTYRNLGLPPGPICVPSVDALEAVLHYSDHDYLYFCAKDDLSGCHYFSEDFEEHRSYADKLWKSLNKRKVK